MKQKSKKILRAWKNYLSLKTKSEKLFERYEKLYKESQKLMVRGCKLMEENSIRWEKAAKPFTIIWKRMDGTRCVLKETGEEFNNSTNIRG